MGIKSFYKRYYDGESRPPLWIALTVGVFAGVMGGGLTDAIVDETTRWDDGAQGSFASASMAAIYKSDMNQLSNDEKWIAKLRYSLDNGQLLASMDDEDVVSAKKIEKLNAKVSAAQKKFESDILSFRNRVVMDRRLSENDLSALMSRYSTISGAKPYAANSVNVRECQTELSQGSPDEIVACSRQARDFNSTLAVAGGMGVGGLGILLMPFTAAAFRRRKTEDELLVAEVSADESITTMLKITYTKPKGQ